MAKHSKTWWGQRFLQTLDEFMDEGRLKRGRSYSSPHRILSFETCDDTISAEIDYIII